jgi:hypothetical protein
MTSAGMTVRKAGWTFGLILAAALLSSAPIWLKFVWPVVSGTGLGAHTGHALTVYGHALGGTFMLSAGALALYVGWTKRWLRFHKWIGYTYLSAGTLASIAALVLSARPAHPPMSLGVATGTLAAFWLAFAAMALRAALNKRFESHREWVIRSYVLTWTFVGCRIAQTVPVFASLGEEGITAGIWLYWIAPILICEICLQWGRGAAIERQSG